MDNRFAVVKFWISNYKAFSALQSVVLRVFATPVSSCASERVFSVTNKLEKKERNHISQQQIQNIIVVRLLMS